MESFNHTSNIENMRQENSLEKKQIEQLMMKLKEKDNIECELIKEINESSETLSQLNIKLKVNKLIEERNNFFQFFMFIYYDLGNRGKGI